MKNYQVRSTQSAASKLLHYVKQRATGRLIIVRKSRQYHFDLFQGQIATAVLSVHRNRRWQRAIAAQVPELISRLQPKSAQHNWERSHLHHAVNEGWLTCKQAREILTDCTREVLFSLVNLSNASVYWQPSNSKLVPRWTLSSRTIQHLYEDGQELSQQWRELGLNPRWVHQAFTLDPSLDLSSAIFSNLTAALDGKHTFWDLASDLSVSRATVSRILSHFLEQGIIQRIPLGDLDNADTSEAQADSEAESEAEAQLELELKLDNHISYIPGMVPA
ncbi:MAG: helix-turn-helix domain-containing protein [Sodalinema sp.]|uniref:helix-turn-helix domain-containing protein n=1 Tax=Sodalinema sp. TaxID=3080550 RepID=UPI0012192B3B|nr:MAG: hypothetical protein EYR95_07855 [Phormidium sp. SL48-SHIP]